MGEKELAEIEKRLGRQLTPEEKRLLQYTEKDAAAPAQSELPKRKQAAQSE